MKACGKLCHRSPAAAKKWLRASGSRTDAKYIYRCKRHGDRIVYHYTRLKPRDEVRPKGDVRLQLLADFKEAL